MPSCKQGHFKSIKTNWRAQSQDPMLIREQTSFEPLDSPFPNLTSLKLQYVIALIHMRNRREGFWWMQSNDFNCLLTFDSTLSISNATSVGFFSLIYLKKVSNWAQDQITSCSPRIVKSMQSQERSLQKLLYMQINKLTSVFYASVLLLMINCIITKWLWNHEPQASGSTANFDNVMTKVIFNKRTDA